MGVLRNKAGNWYYRFKKDGKEFEKVFGPGLQAKAEAEIALAELQQDIRIAKLAGQHWDSFEKLKKSKKPKLVSEAAEEFMDSRRNKRHRLCDLTAPFSTHTFYRNSASER